MPKNTRKGSNAKTLTAKEETFAQQFVLTGNASEAYRAAFKPKKSTDKSVWEQASRLAASVKVKARIEELSAHLKEVATSKYSVTVDRIVQELAYLAFSNPADYYEFGTFERPLFMKNGEPKIDPKTGQQMTEAVPFAHVKPSSGMTREQMAAVAGADMSFSKTGDPVVSVKLADKRAALKDLLQYMKPQELKASVVGAGGGPIKLVISSAEDAL
jgi:phage terminase small subunit